MELKKISDLEAPPEAGRIIESPPALRAIQGKPQMTRRVFLKAATTAVITATAACKKNSTTPTNPTNFVDTFGNLVGTFNGVDAYCNRNSNYRSNQENYYNGAITGYKWLCSEYVQRYYLQIYDYYIHPIAYAGNLYNMYVSEGLVGNPNGGSVGPQVGDIICASAEGYHVAIIREVALNYINVIQQNWFNSSADNCQTLGRNGDRVDPFDRGFNVLGWLRMPNLAR